MHASKNPTPGFKVVCEIHGDLTGTHVIADHVAATIVEDSHAEQCYAGTEIFENESTRFATALEYAEATAADEPEREVNAGLDDFDTCDVCNDAPDLFCCECGAAGRLGEAGGA